jgi:hypothetical protein
MPPLPRLRIAILADLARRIELEGPESARRTMERAEALCAAIDAEGTAEGARGGRTYAEDWVVERITGECPDLEAPAMLVGEALLGDLCALIERLSAAARITESDLTGHNGSGRTRVAGECALARRSPAWLDAPALCARWRISRKTLDRYRRRGLPARRILALRGHHRLVFNLPAIQAFERRHAALLAEAGGFSRIDPPLEARILRRARRYRARFGWSLNQAAARLAQHFGRSHEGIRQLLRRHDARNPQPIFTDPGPLTSRQERVADRAIRRGIEVEQVAHRFGKSKGSIYRAVALQRAQRLRSLVAHSPPPAPEERRRPAQPASHSAVPTSPAIRTGLGAPAPATLADLLAAAANTPPPIPAAERARAAAVIILRDTALARIAALGRTSPSATAMDEIETLLRWSSRLKAELVRSQLPLLIKTIHAGLRREITELPRATAARLLSTSLDALIEAAGRFDPAKGGRLAAPCGLAITRTVSQFARSAGLGASAAPPTQSARPRAMPRLDPAALPLQDWTRRLDPWQPWLEPDPRLRAALPRLPDALRKVLERRHGWDGGPPRKLVELASELDTTRAHAARLEHRAIREALAIARRKASP